MLYVLDTSSSNEKVFRPRYSPYAGLDSRISMLVITKHNIFNPKGHTRTFNYLCNFGIYEHRIGYSCVSTLYEPPPRNPNSLDIVNKVKL